MKKIILTLLITLAIPTSASASITQERMDFMCSVGTLEPYECIKIEPVSIAVPMQAIEMESQETVATTTTTTSDEIQRQQMLIMIEQLQLLIKLLTELKK